MPYDIVASSLSIIPTIQFAHGTTLVTRPITDHPPIIQNTAWGAMATMNMLHPGSPLAPPAQLNGVISLPAQGQQQMEAMAKYIFDMFKNGVGVLTLQEVPDPRSQNFGFLVAELKKLVGTSQLIDIAALEKQWLKTGTHAFGTTILYNPNRFTITQDATAALNNRAAEYKLTEIATNYQIPISNLHGDFNQQAATSHYINGFDGLCLGDTNLRSFGESTHSSVLQTATKPSLTVDSTTCAINTFDIFQDTLSKKVNPHFVPDRAKISQPPVKNTGFVPQVFQIAPLAAKRYLDDFKDYLQKNGLGNLVQGGRIQGCTLTTPGAQSHITISDMNVHQAFMVYEQIQQANATIKTPPPPVFQPHIYRVAPKDASPLLTEFVNYLTLNGHHQLINPQGRIQGVVLTTPGTQSHITINDAVVNQHYLAFEQAQKAKKTPPVVQPPPPVMQPTPPVMQPTPPVMQPTPPVMQPTPPVMQPTPPVMQPTSPVVLPTPPAFHPITVPHPAKNAGQFLADFAFYLAKTGREALTPAGIITGLSLKTPLITLSSGKKVASETANITVSDATIYQALQDYQRKWLIFTEKRDSLQTKFIGKLNLLQKTIESNEKPGSVAYAKGGELRTQLFEAQKEFFDKFTPNLDSISLKKNLDTFCKTCEGKMKEADAVMGRGWLTRQLIAFCKLVSAIVVGVGMAFGVLLGQGMAKQEHREHYSQTFFKSDWSETNSRKAVNDFRQSLKEFKEEVDDNDKGNDLRLS